MPNGNVVLAAASSALLLAACASQAPATAENEAAAVETNGLGNAVEPAGPEPANGSAAPGDEPVPPPDAVSHPDGYLPNAAEPSAPTTEPPGPREKPPATEDDYLRNKAGG